MTCVSLEPLQMGGGVLSSLAPWLREHSWAVLLGVLPHCSALLGRRASTCVGLITRSLPEAPGAAMIRIAGQIYRVTAKLLQS